MQTKAFGPDMWRSMFMIASNYPVTIDIKNKKHLKNKRYNKDFFTGIGNVLPCKFCRRSYKVFLKELPIKNFLNGRRDLMFWLYLIKDKVNKKLINQEKDNLKKYGIKSTFKTTPSPPFKKICKYYDKFRASCSDKTKTCSSPTKIK